MNYQTCYVRSGGKAHICGQGVVSNVSSLCVANTTVCFRMITLIPPLEQVKRGM